MQSDIGRGVSDADFPPPRGAVFGVGGAADGLSTGSLQRPAKEVFAAGVGQRNLLVALGLLKKREAAVLSHGLSLGLAADGAL